MKLFEVGGCVRDELLGVPSKDIDFSVVLTDDEKEIIYQRNQEPFDFMANSLTDNGFKIFLESPEFLTVRAQFPEGDGGFDVKRAGGVCKPGRKRLTADFVLARREGDYTDGRRPDKVEPGDLLDDLARRDFTMNAIAKDEDGVLIDPFNGVGDIETRIIRAVGDPVERLTEDALRAVRALRFSVTKGFEIDMPLRFAMQDEEVLNAIATKISDERIQVELSKMFRFDTLGSIRALSEFTLLTTAMFSGRVSLDATLKTKGRGK